MIMSDDRAVDAAIRLTGVERYRFLCSPANLLPAPNSPADYLEHCRRIVAAGGHPPIVVAVDYGVSGPGPCGTCP